MLQLVMCNTTWQIVPRRWTFEWQEISLPFSSQKLHPQKSQNLNKPIYFNSKVLEVKRWIFFQSVSQRRRARRKTGHKKKYLEVDLWTTMLGRKMALCMSNKAVRHHSSTSLRQKYLNLLETNPLVTKAVTSGVLAGAGDFICQCWIEKSSNLNWKRFCTFTFLGTVYVGPVLHVWYGALGRRLPGVSTSAVMGRLAAGQFVFAPSFVASFFSALLVLDGKVEEIPIKLQNDWWSTTQANWSVWIPAQFLNFRYVPPQFQVLFANFVGLLWNSYLSFVSHD